MIFYFSGTGNSLYVAKSIARLQGEKIISIAKEYNLKKENYEYDLNDNEKIIFIYPIYAWAPPKMVLDFISKLKLNNYNGNYISTIATCGENIGNTINLIENKLLINKLKLDSGFSVVMPNNYMIMGDVDNKESSLKKINDVDKILEKISCIISNKEKGIYNVEKGPVPGFLTKIINPLFNIAAINTSKFYVDENCTGCKICEKVCNVQSIKVDEKPTWGKECTGCLACINYCPKKAIQYGKGTIKKGRYINPKISIEEMFM